MNIINADVYVGGVCYVPWCDECDSEIMKIDENGHVDRFCECTHMDPGKNWGYKSFKQKGRS